MKLEDLQEDDVAGLRGQFARLNEQSRTCPLARPRTPLSPALPSLLIFNTISRSWSFSSPLLYGPRCWCATGVDTYGKLYVASGCGKLWDIEVSKCAEVYDPEHDTWMPIEGLGSSKFSGEAITAVNYEGKLHMVSGRGVFNKVGVMYDAELNRWVDMPHGMKAGWTGTCIVVDGMLLAVDESLGRIRLYQSAFDTWRMLVEHPMLKGLRQVIAAPGSRICGVMKRAHGNGGDSCQSSQQDDVIRIVHLSPSLADSAVDSLVNCELDFIDIAPPAPSVTIVSLQLLSSILTSSPIFS